MGPMVRSSGPEIRGFGGRRLRSKLTCFLGFVCVLWWFCGAQDSKQNAGNLKFRGALRARRGNAFFGFTWVSQGLRGFHGSRQDAGDRKPKILFFCISCVFCGGFVGPVVL
jgi:hypothetical protein